MNRKAKIYVSEMLAGTLVETIEGEYIFQYNEEYCGSPINLDISLTLPKRSTPYHSKQLFPFFDGLIPEGWLLEIGAKNWKIDLSDRMGLLLVLCEDCIGNVSVVAE